MFHKIIFIILASCSLALGQSTSGWQTVTMENGTGNLSTNGAVFASGITNYFAPSYGSFLLTADPFKTATSVVVTNGTITSGSITNTWIVDQSYLVIDDADTFDIDFTFSNTPTLTPRIIRFTGYYDGNPSRSVQAYVYDYVTNGFTIIDGGVIEDGSVDSSTVFSVPSPSTNFISTNGISTVKFLQSNAGSDDFYIDYVVMEFADIVYDQAGVWYPFTGVELSISNNIVVDVPNSCITTTSDGTYRIGWYNSFTGSSNTTFTVRAVTKGVATNIEMWRRIGDPASIGSASAFGYVELLSGATNCWESKCDKSGGWMTVINGHAEVVKMSN